MYCLQKPLFFRQKLVKTAEKVFITLPPGSFVFKIKKALSKFATVRRAEHGSKTSLSLRGKHTNRVVSHYKDICPLLAYLLHQLTFLRLTPIMYFRQGTYIIKYRCLNHNYWQFFLLLPKF
jgi:hypothetical protein